MRPVIAYIVIPCYNEEAVLPETIKRFGELFRLMLTSGLISDKSRIVCVDDGSKDRTWEIITDYSARIKYLNGIKLAHNAGHQNALLAGLMTVKDKADCCISIDADLQDDIYAIPMFIEQFNSGYDVVYGVRSSRDTDTKFKRGTAVFFYKFLKLLGADVVFNSADYRLMSKRALNALAEFKEVNLFLRGLVPLVGFKSTEVLYERNERFAGESKYPLKKMLAFAFEGITSLSVTPIRFVTLIGFVFSLLSIFAAIYGVISYFVGATVGWSSTIISIWLIGGIQLLALGLIGEYVGKIYKEVKNRPRYIIEDFYTGERNLYE
jgi:glycosyltransferase involved in cell wall biosynthesis